MTSEGGGKEELLPFTLNTEVPWRSYDAWENESAKLTTEKQLTLSCSRLFEPKFGKEQATPFGMNTWPALIAFSACVSSAVGLQCLDHAGKPVDW